MIFERLFTSEQRRLQYERDPGWRHKLVLRFTGLVLLGIAMFTVLIQTAIGQGILGQIWYIYFMVPFALTGVQNGRAISRQCRLAAPPRRAGLSTTLEVLAMLCWSAFVAWEAILLVLYSPSNFCSGRPRWPGDPYTLVCQNFWFAGGGAANIILLIVSFLAALIHIYFLIVGCKDKKKARRSLERGTIEAGKSDYEMRPESPAAVRF